MMNLLRFFVLYLLFSTPVFGQFQGFYKTYDYQYGERAYDVVQTQDGGYAMVGDYGVTFGVDSVLVIKADSLGNEEWHKSYGLGNMNRGHGIMQMQDGGYMITGNSTGELYGQANDDSFILKINSVGDTLWSRNYGVEGGLDSFREIKSTPDGGVIISGASYREEFGEHDGRAVKLDADGHTEWDIFFGIEEVSEGCGGVLAITDEGDYIMGGVVDYGLGARQDIWLFKINPSGEVIWDYSYPMYNSDFLLEIIIDSENNIVGVGSTNSFVEGEHEAAFSTFIMKWNSVGELFWTKVIGLGEENNSMATSIVEAENGDYMIVEIDRKEDTSGDISILRVDSDGNEIYEETYGGDSFDTPYKILKSGFNDYIVTGHTDTNCDGLGHSCAFLMKINGEGIISSLKEHEEYNSDITIYPNPSSGQFTIETKFSEAYILKILSVEGKLILEKEIYTNQTNIEIPLTVKGMYFAQISTSDYLKIVKIMVQ